MGSSKLLVVLESGPVRCSCGVSDQNPMNMTFRNAEAFHFSFRKYADLMTYLDPAGGIYPAKTKTLYSANVVCRFFSIPLWLHLSQGQL